MKYPVSVKSLLVIVITIFIIPLWIWTQPAGQGQPDEQGGRRPQGPPPPEAIEACESKSEGDTCEVNTPHGMLNGTCITIENQSACVPEGGPGGQTKQGGPRGRTKRINRTISGSNKCL